MSKTTDEGEELRARPRRFLPPDDVRALSRLSPLRTWGSIGKTLAVTALFVGLGASSHQPLVVAACVVGVATQQHAFAILAHEATHYRLFETRWRNDLAGRFFAVPLFLSLLTYRVLHRTHHNHLYSAIDPDLPLMAGYPRGRMYLVKKLGKDLLGITTFKNYMYFAGKPAATPDADPSRPLDDTSPALRAAAKRDRAIVLGVHLALVPLWIATGWWREVLLLWLLPAFTLLQAILRLRAVAEHGAVPDVREVTRAARTVRHSWVMRALLFPHDVHYHIEHHLYPSVPHYRLAACHRALVARGAMDGAEVTTFSEAMRKVFAPPLAS